MEEFSAAQRIVFRVAVLVVIVMVLVMLGVIRRNASVVY